ncbi:MULTISPECIES: hypothetical protein [unclassified Methanosarcina]|uniref:hypothetical protein n=2 Tax=unclassified Methanosarcina TaxID=2644672 RepID=UPI000AC44F84|nr:MULTISPECIES: hypothetical protein [unclassified Methanosarcina]
MSFNRKSTLKIMASVSVVLMLLTLLPAGVSAVPITKDFHNEKSLGDQDQDRLRDGSCTLSSRASNCNGDRDRLRDGSCTLSGRASNCNGDRDCLRDGSCLSTTSGI